MQKLVLKKMVLFLLLSTLFGFLFALDHARAECGGKVSCAVDGRSYQALLPDGYDGRKALPVLIHFHGWGRTGLNVINNHKISGATRENGVLLLAPNGLGKSWDFWRSPSNDVPFVERIIEDARHRFSIDRKRLYVSGFSYGGAMAWRLACERGADYAAFLPIAGSLWNFNELSECSSPVTLRHVHGLKDTVMDLPRGEGGDPLYSVSPWIALNGCEERPSYTEKRTIYQSSRWDACKSGHEVELETHPYGHIIPENWLSYQLGRLLSEEDDEKVH